MQRDAEGNLHILLCVYLEGKRMSEQKQHENEAEKKMRKRS